MTRLVLGLLAVLAITAPAAGQDIRGLEVCTAEKTMERRTSCLQSNAEFLQQSLIKQKRETQAKIDAMGREVAAQRADLAALKAALAKIQHELAELNKPKPAKK